MFEQGMSKQEQRGGETFERRLFPSIGISTIVKSAN